MFETIEETDSDHSSSFMYWSVPYYWIRELRLAKKSVSWVVSEAVVESTHRTKGGYKETIRAELWYSYSFDAQSYAGHVIRDCCFGWAAVKLLVDRHEKGQKIPIYVNPERPDESYYPSGFGWIEPFLTLFLSLLGTVLILAMILFPFIARLSER